MGEERREATCIGMVHMQGIYTTYSVTLCGTVQL